MVSSLWLSKFSVVIFFRLLHSTHTHTHTHVYIYIYILHIRIYATCHTDKNPFSRPHPLSLYHLHLDLLCLLNQVLFSIVSPCDSPVGFPFLCLFLSQRAPHPQRPSSLCSKDCVGSAEDTHTKMMTVAQQVANAFTVDFVERVAKNAANIADLYGRHATLTVNDFELGISEVHDSYVPIAVQKWALSLQGSRLRVDSVNAAPLYSGVNVFVTMTAFGEMQQYYHIATTLESFQDTYGMDGYYVRHQVIARIGAVAPEPPAPEPTPAAVEKSEAPKKSKSATPEPEAAPAQPAPKPEEAEEPASAAAPAESEDEKKPEPASVSSKPKSWASLVSSAPVKTAEHKPVRVVAHEGGKKPTTESTATATAAPASKRLPPRERKASEAVGDRLMFNTTGSVTDDEIRAALGPMSAHLVSLRNNSAKGHVFMDFAEKANAFDELSKAQPVIGASKVKMSVFRQRSRD
ncbi:hypothetical protein, conserved [Leishmania tarentolae]|uniref:RRM domain-containing protein n=1 Tax=Leishmania tarentolae TaxID=5689 RepID=A0A640KNV3_LEITA|nr:hypothetical protein, conserved [Leishmania tarentolae]